VIADLRLILSDACPGEVLIVAAVKKLVAERDELKEWKERHDCNGAWLTVEDYKKYMDTERLLSIIREAAK
jgi:hypothetical protein